MNKISIIVPVYNSEKFLVKCLNSIINQTYENIEILLIDDASSDRSLEICKRYKEKDKRIILLENKENRGVSYSRNLALKRATGKFLAFIDSDDYVEKDYIEYLYNAIVKDNYDISICGYRKEFENKIIDHSKNKELILNQEQILEEVCYNKVISISVWGKLFKRDLFNKVLFPENKIYEDIKAIGDVLLKSAHIIYIPDIKYHYLIRKNSLAFSNYSEKEKNRIELSKNFIDQIIAKYPELEIDASYSFIDNSIAVCNKQLLAKIYDTEEIKNTKRYIKQNFKNIFKFK